MTTAVIEAATQAAFHARYHSSYRPRLFLRFENLDGPIQLRWTLIATKVVQGVVKSGREFRDAYREDMGAPDRDADKEWLQLARDDRENWNEVYAAADRAWHAAEAQERAQVAA